MTLSPGPTFHQRGRKLVKSKNPQYVSPNRNPSNLNTPSA